MSAGSVVNKRRIVRKSSNHMDHVSHSPTDTFTLGVVPDEYLELARKSVLANGGEDAQGILSMLGLDEVTA